MASINFDSFISDISTGAIPSVSAASYKVMLVTSAYTPAKGTHHFRSDVTNEVTGTGYTAGGVATTVTVALNTTTHQETYTFSNPSWVSPSTITARAAVIYVARGGASSADNLVAYVDFVSDVSSTAGTFSVTFTTPITIQN